MEQLAEFLAYFIVTLGTIILGYQRVNRKRVAQDQIYEDEQTRLVAENERLTTRLAEIDIVLADLRKQLEQLSHFKTLYETLKESHDLLKTDHESLKKDFEQLKIERENERDGREKLQEKYDLLAKENERLFKLNEQITIELNVHKSNWTLLGESIQGLLKRDDGS